MRVCDVGSPEAARRKWEAYVAHGRPTGRGRMAGRVGGGRSVGERWMHNHLLVLIEGECRAYGEDLRGVWLEPGQGAFWQAGEWYMFQTGPLRGSCEILELDIEGRDLDEFLTFPEEDAASNGGIDGTQKEG